jgi:hypothetical protein
MRVWVEWGLPPDKEKVSCDQTMVGEGKLTADC